MIESPRLCIVILEDDADRQAAMQERLQDRLPQYETCFFATAAGCIDFLHRRLDSALAIVLDHDLDLIPGGSGRLLDTGTGRDVADYLSTQKPSCPVLIHTTNAMAGDGMWQVLHDAGWMVERVVPYGDLEWISEGWFPALRSLMFAWTRHTPRRTTTVR